MNKYLSPTLMILLLMTFGFTGCETVNDSYFAAQDSERAGDYKGCVASLDKYIAHVDAPFWASYENRAKCKSALEDYEGELTDYQKAADLIGKTEAWQSNLTEIKSKLAKLKRELGMNIFFRDARRANPQAYSIYQSAVSKHNARDYQGALAEYAKITGNFEYAEYYYERGNTKLMMGDPRNALGDFQKGLSLNPISAGDFYWAIGKAQREAGDLHGAITSLSKAISLNPDVAFYYESRAKAELKSDDLAAAIADFRKAIALETTESRVNSLNTALIDLEKKEHPQAYAMFERAIEKHNAKDYRGAVDDYSSAIAASSNFGDYYWQRGTAKSWLNDTQWSDDLDKAIALNPYKGEYYFARSIAVSGGFTEQLRYKLGFLNLAVQYAPSNARFKESRDEVAYQFSSAAKRDSDASWERYQKEKQRIDALQQEQNARDAADMRRTNDAFEASKNPCGFSNSCTLGQGSEAKTYVNGKRVLSGKDVEECRLHPTYAQCN